MEYGPHLKAFGTTLKECRSQRGMSREELAKRANVPVERLAAVEAGIPDGLGLAEICRIAQALDVSPCELMKRYERLVREARWW